MATIMKFWQTHLAKKKLTLNFEISQSGNDFEILKTHLEKKEVDSEFWNSRKAVTILKFWKLTLQKRSWLWILKFLHSGNCGIFEVLTVSDSITPILKVITCNILTFGFKGHYIYLVVETWWWWWIKMDKRWIKMDKDE